MEKLVWTDKFETGIIEIDIHHRNLFNIFNILQDAIINNKSSLVIKSIVEEVERYSKYHMAFEENILLKYSCLHPNHPTEHDHFKIVISDFIGQYGKTKSKILALGIQEYLYEWIHKHILRIDMTDIKLLKEKLKQIGKFYLEEDEMPQDASSLV